VAQGGTGASSFTTRGILYGNGSSAIAATSAGTSGQVLTSNGSGSDPTFQTISGGVKLTANVQPNGSSASGASLNVSSVVDGGTGQNTINATNAFASALGVAALIGNHDTSYNRGGGVKDNSASAFLCYMFQSSTGSLTDADSAHSNSHFGDLA
tara:strand:- start:1307 stop:1768 length:462 start_codon:yes stop_codon:yes gene_type:complete